MPRKNSRAGGRRRQGSKKHAWGREINGVITCDRSDCDGQYEADKTPPKGGCPIKFARR